MCGKWVAFQRVWPNCLLIGFLYTLGNDLARFIGPLITVEDCTMSSIRRYIAGTLFALVAAFVAAAASAEPWSFGLISDTQWRPATPENRSVATHIVDAVNRQFVDAKVDLVLQVGDLTDDGSNAALDMRAAHNRVLADARIPFYPLRGNHEGSVKAAIHFGKAFPNLPGTPGGGGSSPELPGEAGHTYSFVHKGVKFVLLDQFTLADGSPKGRARTVADYQPWIDRELSAHDHRHAFVLAHKDLLGQNHKDNLFGVGDEKPEMQNAFFASLDRNGVRYYLCGHDHFHYRSLVASPDRRATVEQIIGASDSYKFYAPKKPFSKRDQPLAQDLYKIGYYIYTVDGPRLTVRYYAAAPFGDKPANPQWQLRETFGYSLNGRAFLVKSGDSYANVADSVSAGGGFVGTAMQIRSGTNRTSGLIVGGQLAKLVTTGWSPKNGPKLASDVLTLWGMAGELGSNQTDTFVLSMSFQRGNLGDALMKSGTFGLLARDADGPWRLAVDANEGGRKSFVFGPWNKDYPLGTYGIDLAANTAWAVINHASDFAVGQP